MAKRKLNKPLLIIVCAAVAALIGGGLFVAYSLLPKDPRPYIENAERAEAEGGLTDQGSRERFEEAVRYYGKAFVNDNDPKTRQIWAIRRGDILWILGRDQEAFSYYRGALKTTPNSLSAQLRIVELCRYRCEIASGEQSLWTTALEEANRLIDMVKQHPADEAANHCLLIGYRLRAQANQALGGADRYRQALDDYAMLRGVAPYEPAGYAMAAAIMISRSEVRSAASTQSEPTSRPDRPLYDLAGARKLIASFPANATAAQLSRFRPYQAQFELVAGAGKRESIDAARKLLEQVVDPSLMDRRELLVWANMAEALRMQEMARKVFGGFGNDEVAVLMRLAFPPARQELVQACNHQPRSLTGLSYLTRSYMNGDPPDLAKAEECIVQGLQLPVATRGAIRIVQINDLYNLMSCRARLLIIRADNGQRQRELYAKAREVLDELKNLVQQAESRHEYQTLMGIANLRLDQVLVAQKYLEEALSIQDRLGGAVPGHERLTTILALADTYRRKQELGAADALLRRVPAEYSDFPRVLLTRAEVALGIRNFDYADTLVDQVLKKHPDMPEALAVKEQVLRGLNKHDEANAISRKLLAGRNQSAEDDPEFIYKLGVTSVGEEDLDGAFEQFERALKKKPDYWAAAQAMMAIRLVQDRKPDAIAVIQKFLDRNKDHKQALVVRAQLEQGREEAAKLLAELRRKDETPLQKALREAAEAVAAANRPGMEKAMDEAERLASDTQKPAVRDQRFRMLLQLKAFDVAWQYVDQLGGSDGLGGLSFRADLLFEEAAAAASLPPEKQQEKWAEAYRTYREVLKQRRSDSRSRTRAAIARYYSQPGPDARDDAIEELRLAVRDNPLDRQAWVKLVQLLYETPGRKAEAWTEADKAFGFGLRDPYLQEVQFDRLSEQDPDKAIAQREQVRKRRPDELGNLIGLAYLYDRQNKTADAETCLLEALKVVPDKDRLKLMMEVADFYRRHDQPGKGEQLIRDYVTAHPDWPAANQALAEYLKTLERFEDADIYYNAAVTKGPSPQRFMDQAEFYRLWNKPDKAIEAVRCAQAAAGQPHPDIQRRLAEMQLFYGKLPDAEATIGSFRRNWPEELSGEVLLGGLYVAQEKYKEALACFDRVLAKRPSAVALYWRARAAYLADPSNIQAAIQNLKMATDRDPAVQGGDAAFRLADLYVSQGYFTEAVLLLERVIERNPTSLDPHIQMIRLLSREPRRSADLERRLADARKLFSQVPRFIIEAARVAQRQAAMAEQDKDDVTRRAKLAEAEKAYRRILEIDPKSEAAVIGLCQVLGPQKRWADVQAEAGKWLKIVPGQTSLVLEQKAYAEGQQKQFDAMLQTLEEATKASEADPLSVQKFVGLADLAMGPQAAAEFDRFVSAKPDSAWRKLLKVVWSANENSAAAGRAMDELKNLAATAKDEDQPVWLLNLAFMAQRCERYQESADYYKKLIDRVGEDNLSYTVLNNYAYLLADNLNQPKAAVRLAEKALKRSGARDMNVLDTVGWCLVLGGEVDRGVAVLNEASLKGRSPVVFYHLARACEMRNKRDDAMRYARQAVEAGYENGKPRNPPDEYSRKAEDLINKLRPSQ